MNFSGFDLSTIQDVYVGGVGFSYIYYGSNLVWQKSTPPVPVPYDEQYFTMEALEDGTFGFTNGVSQPTVYYSIDNGVTWTDFPRNTSISVNTGDKVLYKRDASGVTDLDGYNMKLSSTCNFKVYGNVQSLIYSDNFINTTDLKNKDWVLAQLLMNNDKLIDAQNLILPATTITKNGYRQMFSGCTSLTTAPALPATTINDTSYGWVFADCSSLTTPPVMPTSGVSISGSYSYKGMFKGCTSLTIAPTLPATTLGTQTYQEMFKGCTSLTIAPTLPATTLGTNCYANMFQGCTSLTTAPVLPATTLASNCYQYMFYNCSSLNYIKCLATDISATNCTQNWVQGVAEYGTFISADNMTGWTMGSSGIPTKWLAPKVYENQYLTIESLEDDNDMYWMYHNETSSDYRQSIEYSYNNGTWISKTSSTSQSSSNKFVTMQQGDKIRIRATHAGYSNYPTLSWNYFKPNKTVKIYGNIMSLLYGDNFAGHTTIEWSGNWATQYKFSHMFSDTNITDVSKLVLPATTFEEVTATPHCPYGYMFFGNTSIRIAPELPAINTTQNCYSDMFNGCTNLQYINCYAPVINATYCSDWLVGVNSTGTFVTHNNPTYIRGFSGIPTGWSIQDV